MQKESVRCHQMWRHVVDEAPLLYVLLIDYKNRAHNTFEKNYWEWEARSPILSTGSRQIVGLYN